MEHMSAEIEVRIGIDCHPVWILQGRLRSSVLQQIQRRGYSYCLVGLGCLRRVAYVVASSAASPPVYFAFIRGHPVEETLTSQLGAQSFTSKGSHDARSRREREHSSLKETERDGTNSDEGKKQDCEIWRQQSIPRAPLRTAPLREGKGKRRCTAGDGTILIWTPFFRSVTRRVST